MTEKSETPSRQSGLLHIYPSVDFAWQSLLEDLLRAGWPVAPRGGPTIELVAYRRTFDMRFPIVTIAQRQLGYRFLPAEAAWILSGDDKVKNISGYSQHISRFSDDGDVFFGAYGPKIHDQLPYVINALVNDKTSRQAVISIWRESPPKTKDVPCTLSVQFLIRGPFLHTIVNMRSSDAWLGWPYDVFNFTMLTGYLMLLLQDEGVGRLQLGTLTLNAGSQHLYELNKDGAVRCVGLGAKQLFQYQAFDPYLFESAAHLLSHLWALADHDDTPYDWAREIVTAKEVHWSSDA